MDLHPDSGTIDVLAENSSLRDGYLPQFLLNNESVGLYNATGESYILTVQLFVLSCSDVVGSAGQDVGLEGKST